MDLILIKYPESDSTIEGRKLSYKSLAQLYSLGLFERFWGEKGQEKGPENVTKNEKNV